jgi:transcriptional regulator with XRE-family HTH domain
MMAAGLESEDMARECCRSVETVRRYMRGTPPPQNVLEKWAAVTGCSVEQLKGDAPMLHSGDGGKQDHPGLDELARDKALRARHHIEDAEIERARTIIVPWPIATAEDAVEAVLLLRRIRPA